MKKRLAALLIIITISWLALSAGIYAESEPEYTLGDITAYVRERGYLDYLEQYPDAVRPDAEIIIPASDYSASDMQLEIISDFAGSDQEVLMTEETGYVEWTFEVEQAGLYNLAIKYYPLEGRGVDIERELWINGERPFDNAQYLKFYRVWGDEGDFIVDSLGNEIRSKQIEKPEWIYADVKDPLGYFQEPYSFYLNQGINTIRLVSDGTGCAGRNEIINMSARRAMRRYTLRTSLKEFVLQQTFLLKSRVRKALFAHHRLYFLSPIMAIHQ